MRGNVKGWAWFDDAFGRGEAKRLLDSSRPAIFACWEQILLLSFYARYWVGHKAGVRRAQSGGDGRASGRYRSMFTGDDQARLGIERRLRFLMLAQHECRDPSEQPVFHLIERLLDEGVGYSELLTQVRAQEPSVARRLESQSVYENAMFSELQVNCRPRYSYRLMLNALCNFIPMCQKMLDVRPEAILREAVVTCVKQACQYSLDASMVHQDMGRVVDTETQASPSFTPPTSDKYTPKGNNFGAMATFSMTVQEAVEHLTSEQKKVLFEDIKTKFTSLLNDGFLGVYFIVGRTQKRGDLSPEISSSTSKVWGLSQNQAEPGMLALTVCKSALESALVRGDAANVLKQLAILLTANDYPLIPLDAAPSSVRMESIADWYESNQVLQLHQYPKRLRRYIIGMLLFDIYSGHGELGCVYGPSGLSVANSGDLIGRMTETKAMQFTTIVLRHALYYGSDISSLHGKDHKKSVQQNKTIKDLLKMVAPSIATEDEVRVYEIFETWAQIDSNVSGGQTERNQRADAVIKHRFKGLYKEMVDNIERVRGTISHQVSCSNSQSCYFNSGIPFALWAK